MTTAKIPKKIKNGSVADLVSLGFKFHEQDTDAIFVQCELPDGWEIELDKNALRKAHLLDSLGNIRATMTWKSETYDSRASMKMHCRYTIETEIDHSPSVLVEEVFVMDNGLAIKSFGSGVVGYHTLDEKAEFWLDENYPDWQNPMAHWQ